MIVITVVTIEGQYSSITTWKMRYEIILHTLIKAVFLLRAFAIWARETILRNKLNMYQILN